MAGGAFSALNKVRPGAYINFETRIESGLNIGTRGIATMALPLKYGAENNLIEVSAQEFYNGDALSKIGLMPQDADALLIDLALRNCSIIKLYNTNKTAVKATKTLTGGLVITAKYGGTFGNKIAILIKSSGSKFDVETYANGYHVDTQKVSGISDLVDNDYVTFSGTGLIQATESTLLEDGTDGTAMQATEYLDKYFELLRVNKFDVLAAQNSESSEISKVVAFIEELREKEGKYVQAVVANYTTANYEGIINNVNGVVINDTSITANQFVAWVAGAVAGAEITESITGKIVEGATSIVGALSNDGIIDALNGGKFVLSLNQDGAVKVEKDINSLHTFTVDKNYIFSKNRVIRELDYIGSNIESIWENTYLGKVSNNDNGRTLFKSSIIAFLTDLQNSGAIQDFDSASVEVTAGPDIDSVVASIAVKPVDSMEFLYMTIKVEQ